MEDWPSRPRAGSPETYNFGVEEITLMVSPFAPFWLLPLYGLIQPTNINVAALCDHAPSPGETWSMADLLNSLNPALHQLETDKLIRMAEAAIWPTLCEFYDPGPETSFTRAHLVHDDTFGNSVGSENGVVSYSSYTEEGPSLMTQNADFWLLLISCDIPSQDEQTPRLFVQRPAWDQRGGGITLKEVGAISDQGAPAPWPNGEPRLLAMRTIVPEAIWDPGEPHAGSWYLQIPAGIGEWTWRLQAWAFGPPPVVPWEPAPALPQVFQFSDECATALCTMAANYPPPASSPPPPTPKTVNSVFGGDLVAGGQFIDVPAGAISATLYTNAPDDYARIGGAPEVVWNTGHVAIGTEQGFYPSEKIKHSGQIVGPFPPYTSSLAIDLSPGVTGQVFFMVETD